GTGAPKKPETAPIPDGYEIALLGTEHSSVLTQDEGAMYFFVQALMEKRDISNEERLDLIYVMPKQYQKYLMKRFGFHPIPYS
ncbi:hypothetical protein, partial [Thalassovita autumnalis]|uniref:hypothetical protein n=1 Tax=Thalassovita autumnalis TaxID=2072972 RepID=UPI000AE30FCA